MAREVGTVVWFNGTKGYGFIRRPNGAGEIFVHYSDIQAHGYKTLEKDEEVEYEVGKGQKGPQAMSVVRLNPPAAGSSSDDDRPKAGKTKRFKKDNDE